MYIISAVPSCLSFYPVPPRVDVTPSQLSVIEGNSFSLFCVVTPSLPVTWSKVNGSIQGGSENKTTALRVSKAEVEHQGTYRCYASNPAGSSEGFASVTVFGKTVNKQLR